MPRSTPFGGSRRECQRFSANANYVNRLTVGVRFHTLTARSRIHVTRSRKQNDVTTTQNRAGRTRIRLAAIAAVIATTAALAAGAPAQAQNAPEAVPGFPAPTEHTQKAFDPEDDFTAKWTRADARQLKAMSDPAAPSRENSLPEEYTMPTVPQDFPDMSN